MSARKRGGEKEGRKREREERSDTEDALENGRYFARLDGDDDAVERPRATAPPSTSCGRPSLK